MLASQGKQECLAGVGAGSRMQGHHIPLSTPCGCLPIGMILREALPGSRHCCLPCTGGEGLPSCLSPSLHPPLPVGSQHRLSPQAAGIPWPVPAGGPARGCPCGARVAGCFPFDSSGCVSTCVLLGDPTAKGKCSLHLCHTAMFLFPVPMSHWRRLWLSLM